MTWIHQTIAGKTSRGRILPAAFKRKLLRYANLAADAEDQEVHQVEVGCRGFMVTSTTKLLKEVGVRGQTTEACSFHCKKQTLAVAERDSMGLLIEPPVLHTPRSDQPAKGQPRVRV